MAAYKMIITVALVGSALSADLNQPRPAYQLGPSYQPRPSYQPQPQPQPTYKPQPAYKPEHAYKPEPAYAEEPAKYAFDYAVANEYSGVDFAADETRDGAATSGSYRVALPDGRVQTVTYTVDGESGFVAEVTYEGEAQYPEAPSKAAPAPYKAAPALTYRPRPQYPQPTTAAPAEA